MERDTGGYRQINKSLNICAFQDYLDTQQARLPDLANVEQLTPRVLRVLGQNPGKVRDVSFRMLSIFARYHHRDSVDGDAKMRSLQFTFQGTNTYIVGTGYERIIVDTGGGVPAWAELISSTLKALNIKLSGALLTHWHGDHTGGVPDLLKLYPDLRNSIYKHTPDSYQQPIADGQLFCVEGATVRALHAPGHSEDHMCFILEEEGAMFTGDNILGHGTSAVEDLGLFMDSLGKMLAQRCKIGYSAHSSTVVDLPGKITQELATKRRRERQVMQVLNRVQKTERSLTVKDLVTKMYGHELNKETRELALEPFIDEVLRKLAGDGQVAFEKRGTSLKKWFSLAAPREKVAASLRESMKVEVDR